VYDVAFAEAYPLPPDVSGYGIVTVGRDVVLHIRGRGGIGEIEAPSPIKAFAASLGVALSKVEHELSVFTNGAQGGLVVTFPQNVTREQAERWRDQFESVHAGPTNAGRTKVLGNGASITQIGMTMAEAQFVESVNLSVADIARILNVPAWLLGVGDKTQRPLSPEHEMQRWLYQGLGPRLARIESALNNDSDLFLASPFFAGFDPNDVVRGALITEDTIAHQQIQDGRLLVDEWRLEHGRDPLPGGVGMIPQITPVGGAPNPNLAAVTEGMQDEPV
jgi:HK97 family phage portal protein